MLFYWLLSIVTPWASVSLAEDELSIRDPVLQEALDAIDIEKSGPHRRKRSRWQGVGLQWAGIIPRRPCPSRSLLTPWRSDLPRWQGVGPCPSRSLVTPWRLELSRWQGVGFQRAGILPRSLRIGVTLTPCSSICRRSVRAERRLDQDHKAISILDTYEAHTETCFQTAMADANIESND